MPEFLNGQEGLNDGERRLGRSRTVRTQKIIVKVRRKIANVSSPVELDELKVGNNTIRNILTVD